MAYLDVCLFLLYLSIVQWVDGDGITGECGIVVQIKGSSLTSHANKMVKEKAHFIFRYPDDILRNCNSPARDTKYAFCKCKVVDRGSKVFTIRPNAKYLLQAKLYVQSAPPCSCSRGRHGGKVT
jgi:hypothetical protein